MKNIELLILRLFDFYKSEKIIRGYLGDRKFFVEGRRMKIVIKVCACLEFLAHSCFSSSAKRVRKKHSLRIILIKISDQLVHNWETKVYSSKCNFFFFKHTYRNNTLPAIYLISLKKVDWRSIVFPSSVFSKNSIINKKMANIADEM